MTELGREGRVGLVGRVAPQSKLNGYYIPLACMVPRDADNIVAAGRCVDADVQALSAIRVMGPCIAMGTAAAHALDLAGTRAVHDVDLAELQRRLTDNLDRTDEPVGQSA